MSAEVNREEFVNAMLEKVYAFHAKPQEYHDLKTYFTRTLIDVCNKCWQDCYDHG